MHHIHNNLRLCLEIFGVCLEKGLDMTKGFYLAPYNYQVSAHNTHAFYQVIDNGLVQPFGFFKKIDDFNNQRFIAPEDDSDDIQVQFSQTFEFRFAEQFIKKRPEFVDNHFRYFDRAS